MNNNKVYVELHKATELILEHFSEIALRLRDPTNSVAH